MKKKVIFICLLFISIISAVFYLSLQWHTVLYSFYKIPRDKLTCMSHSNFWEDYQTNCFIPDRENEFKFKEKLNCKAYTNQQFDEGLYSSRDGNRTTTMMIKSESTHFTLEFQTDRIVRSRENGSMDPLEDYTIIKDENSIIQAIRPTIKENFNDVYAYDFLTFSKKSGRGMEVWQNISRDTEQWTNDSIGSHFFQCE